MARVTHYTILRLCVLIAFSLILFWNLTLYLSVDKTTTSHLLFSAGYGSLYFLGAAIGFWGFRKFGLVSSVGRALLYLSLGMAAFGVALVIWSYYAVALNIDIPFPSWSDAFFVLFIPLVCLSFLSLLQSYKMPLLRRLTTEGVVIFIATIFIVFRFIVQLEISSELSPLAQGLNIFYPLGDVLFITIVLSAIRVYGGKLRGNLYIFMFGLIAQAVGDFLFINRSSAGTYWNGDIADSVYMLSGFILSLGIVQTIADLEN